MRLWALGSALALGEPSPTPELARVHSDDVHRFFEALDAHQQGLPLKRALRRHYKRPGSVGLQEAWRINIGSVGRLASSVRAARPYYEALQPLLEALPEEREEIRVVFERMEAHIPDAVHPDVYLVVGRLNSAGTLSDTGLFVSIEMFGRNTGVPFREGSWLARVIKPMTDLDAIVAHELAHYQQSQPNQTVLERCLNEGIADVFAEQLSGRHLNPTVYAFAEAHESEIWTHFLAQRHGHSTRDWLYQRPHPPGWPQDLGYYVGYRIAMGHMERAETPSEGLQRLLDWTDAELFFQESGVPEREAN
jgi:hypothetical protein